MHESLDSLFTSGPTVVGAKEAGAGALLAALIGATAGHGRVVALVEEPALRYFSPGRTEIIEVRRAAHGGWNVAIDRLLADIDPKRIVVGASAGPTIEKDLIDAGHRGGRRVVSVVDHYWNLWQRYAGATPGERWRYRPDTIFVPDRACERRLQEAGCPVGDIRVFRHPLLEPAAMLRSLQYRQQGRATLGFRDADIVVLFVSEYGFDPNGGWDWEQPPAADIEGLARELLTVAGELAHQGLSVRVLVRPHPAERRDWGNVLEGVGDLAVIDRGLDKAELFSVVDAAFGLNSMLLAEAAQCGVPSYCRFPSGSYAGPKLAEFRREIAELTSPDAVRQVICQFAPHVVSRSPD